MHPHALNFALFSYAWLVGLVGLLATLVVSAWRADWEAVYYLGLTAGMWSLFAASVLLLVRHVGCEIVFHGREI